MEQFPLNRKESGINRIVGFDSPKEGEFLEYFKSKYEGNTPDPREKEKTIELQEFIDRINNQMHGFLSQYGVEAIEIPAGNVHIVDKIKFTEEEWEKFKKQFQTENGFYSALKQEIVIVKDYGDGELSFLQTLVHEMIHLQGFYSYQKSDKGDADITFKKGAESASMNIRRSGFSIGTKDGNRLLFHKLNESVITELQIRFEKAYMTKWPELKQELRARDEYIEHVAQRDGIPITKLKESVGGIKRDGALGYKWVTYAYHDEREAFNHLVDELYKENKSIFKSREQVFSLFAEATMTGKLLKVARLIEDTFGKGSFRMIGEKSSDKPGKS